MYYMYIITFLNRGLTFDVLNALGYIPVTIISLIIKVGGGGGVGGLSYHITILKIFRGFDTGRSTFCGNGGLNIFPALHII